MKKYFYGTAKENTFGIMRDGIKADADGRVYLADSTIRALAIAAISSQHKSNAKKEFSVIPVYLNDSDVVKEDASKDVFKFYYEGDISPDKVEQDLQKVGLYEF